MNGRSCTTILYSPTIFDSEPIRNDTMALRSVPGSQSCSTAFVSGVKISSRDLAWDKVRIPSAWTDQTWRMSALQRESDPCRLQRAQYQSNWKRITALASHSRVKRFHGRGKYSEFFCPHNLRTGWGGKGGGGAAFSAFIFEATFETGARHYAERFSHYEPVCSGLLLLPCDDSRWYFNQTAFYRFPIPRKRRDFKGPGSAAIRRVVPCRAVPCQWGPNWRGNAKFTLHFVGSAWNGLAEKSNSRALEIKGARRRETRNLISLFLAALARKCAALTIRALNFEPSKCLLNAFSIFSNCNYT